MRSAGGITTNRDEAKRIVMLMYAYYPNHKPKSVDDATMVVNAWNLALGGYEYKQVENALVAFVLTDKNGFPPSVGQILGCMNLNADMSRLNDSEAWSLVSKAIRKSTYYSEEEFEKLPLDVQKAVGSPPQLKAWAMDESFNEGVESSNFKRVYRQVLERNKTISTLPPSMRPQIEYKPYKRIEKQEEQRQEAFERCNGEEYVKQLKRKMGVE